MKVRSFPLVLLVSLLLINVSSALAERYVRIRGKAYPAAAAAKSIEPVVKILAPLSGTTIDDTSIPFYNPATEEIAVTGIFTALKELSLKRKLLGIFVNKDNTPALVKFSKKTITVGGIRYLSGTFVKTIVLPRDVRWPLRSLTAEIVNVNNTKVLARDRVSFFDMRDSASANAHASLSTPIMGMSTQLTGSGIGDVNDPNRLAGAEIAYLSALPQPSLADFNTEFTQSVRQIPTYDNNQDLLNACIPYADLTEPKFSQETEFGPFLEALVWANAEHQGYEVANDACNSLPNPAAILACKAVAFASFCVHDQPHADNFELCVDQIEGDVEEGTISSVSDASLRFLPATAGVRAQVESRVALSGVKARVEGRMRGLFVRWKNQACLDRPRFSMSDTAITDKPWLDSWTYCPNLQISAAGASSIAGGGLPSNLNIQLNPNEPEALRATLVQDGHLAAVAPVVNPDSGNCGLSFIISDVFGMLNSQVSEVMDKLNATWYSGPDDRLSRCHRARKSEEEFFLPAPWASGILL